MSRWPESRAGCIFAGSCSRTYDDLNASTVLLACDEGWDSHDGARVAAEALHAQETTTGVLWCSDPDDSEFLGNAALSAVDWLNEHVAPEGHSFVFDDGLYVWADEENEDA